MCIFFTRIRLTVVGVCFDLKSCFVLWVICFSLLSSHMLRSVPHCVSIVSWVWSVFPSVLDSWPLVTLPRVLQVTAVLFPSLMYSFPWRGPLAAPASLLQDPVQQSSVWFCQCTPHHQHIKCVALWLCPPYRSVSLFSLKLSLLFIVSFSLLLLPLP